MPFERTIVQLVFVLHFCHLSAQKDNSPLSEIIRTFLAQVHRGCVSAYAGKLPNSHSQIDKGSPLKQTTSSLQHGARQKHRDEDVSYTCA